MKIYLSPQPSQFPSKGGVRTHLLKITKHLNGCLTDNIQEADITHTESAWVLPTTDLPSAYICHGGFVPTPLPVVTTNLKYCDVIISVSRWIADRFFNRFKGKTVVIPNGIDLEDFQTIPPSRLKPGYVLYAKEWDYYTEDLCSLAYSTPHKFVTTVWPKGVRVPPNVTVIGLQSPEKIKSYLKDAGCLLLTGSEVCPTMLLEAWACRTPVLAKAIDGSAELMGDNIGGYLYNSVEEGVHKLQGVLEDGVSLGQQGFEEVKAKYQWKDLIKKYHKVYEELIS